jgi:3-oxoacyl-[acyl-carrier protein] reductase
MTKYDFNGKRALVIGGSRGIGKGVVEALISFGADVFYASRNPSKDIDAQFISVDLHSEDQIVSLFSELKEYGQIDFVINTAAINFCKKIDEIDILEWDEVLKINLRASFLICQQASILMKKQRSGKIVNVSSIAGRSKSIVSGIHYVSSKSGLIGLTRQLAYELGPYNINVNVVCPSQTLSDMLNKSMSKDQLSLLASNIPLRRIATVEDQVGPILFLCSESSKYITGSVIDVNGGQL